MTAPLKSKGPALLTREGEVRWARKLEEATRAARAVVLSSPLAAGQLRALDEGLERRELHPGRVFNLNELAREETEDAVEEAQERLRRHTRRRRRKSEPIPPLAGPVVEEMAKGLHHYVAPFRSQTRALDRMHATVSPDELIEIVEHGEKAPFAACTKLGVSLPEFRELQRELQRERMVRERAQEEAGMSLDGLLELDDRAQRALARRKRAQRTMVEANMGLVFAQAHKYSGNGLDFDDLVQEGSLGLLIAVEKFDHRRGFKFSTYATWWIRQAITRSLIRSGRTIRLPIHVATTLGRAKRASESLAATLERAPTTAEIAEEIGVPSAKLQTMFDASRMPLSLDAPVRADSDLELADTLPAPDQPDPVHRLGQRALEEQLARLLLPLPPRERGILRHRFGLRTDALTRDEIGRRFSLSRERIRQLERNALLRLRRSARSRRLRTLLE